MDYRKMKKQELVDLLKVMERTAEPQMTEVAHVVERLKEFAGKKRESTFLLSCWMVQTVSSP